MDPAIKEPIIGFAAKSKQMKFNWVQFINHFFLSIPKSSQVKSSFIVILLHVWTYSGMKCQVSQDHGATYQLNVR